ncbi:MAG TPA: DUF445 family protein [Chitinophagaceae bacterium]|nr:DUF445 family protein [Chitinophagaceae bacterium]
MNIWVIILIPLISAFIGWITIRLLIKMLFHPRKPKKIFGIKFQGILPKKKQQFAEKIGSVVSNKFFSYADIEQKISDPQNLKKILPSIETHVDEFLQVRLSKEMPMISMFIGDKTIHRMKETLLKEIELLFPKVMQQYAGDLKTQFNLEQIIISKLSAFSTDSLEKIFYQALSKELRLAGLMGALIGFIIGIVQVLIIWLTQ